MSNCAKAMGRSIYLGTKGERALILAAFLAVSTKCLVAVRMVAHRGNVRLDPQ